MSIELWVEGVIIEYKSNNERFMIRSVGKSEIILASIATGETVSLALADIDEFYKENEIKLLAQSRNFGELTFVDLTEKEQKETNRKYKYIKRLVDNDIKTVTKKTSELLIKSVAEELNEAAPHWQSVRAWYKSFEEAGNKMRGLYPRHRFKGNSSIKIDSRVLEIIKKSSKRYFSTSQPSMASVYRNVQNRIYSYNLDNPNDVLTCPTYCAVQRRVLEVSYKHKKKSRAGVKSFNDELLDTKSGIETRRVLERVEIDHTQLDIHVLHDDYKTLLGRPFITILIDHYSRMVLGLQLSFENPSYASVAMACVNAFLPKDNFLQGFDCEGIWPAHGIPEVIVADNGKEFWSESFNNAINEVGSVLQYCPVKKGNYKSRVERFFGLVNALVLDDLPGVVRKSGKCGDAYDGRKEAKITFTEFKSYFLKWLTTVYHHTPIKSLGKTPFELWVESERNVPIPIEDQHELAIIFMCTQNRKLDGSGINIFSLNYNSNQLKDLYRRDGPSIQVIRYNPFDIGYILVRDEINNIFIKVECKDFDAVSGVSDFEYKKIRSQLTAVNKLKLESDMLKKARLSLHENKERLHTRNANRKTQVTTSKSARIDKIGVTNINPAFNNEEQEFFTIEMDEELSLDGWDIES